MEGSEQNSTQELSNEETNAPPPMRLPPTLPPKQDAFTADRDIVGEINAKRDELLSINAIVSVNEVDAKRDHNTELGLSENEDITRKVSRGEEKSENQTVNSYSEVDNNEEAPSRPPPRMHAERPQQFTASQQPVEASKGMVRSESFDATEDKSEDGSSSDRSTHHPSSHHKHAEDEMEDEIEERDSSVSSTDRSVSEGLDSQTASSLAGSPTASLGRRFGFGEDTEGDFDEKAYRHTPTKEKDKSGILLCLLIAFISFLFIFVSASFFTFVLILYCIFYVLLF
jgi:hypothetical protein